MASAYNLTVGISLAILLAILLGLLGVGVWRQLTRQMTRVGLVAFLIGAGTPSFLLVGNEPVFLFERHMGTSGAYNEGNGWGPIVSHWLDEIQWKINQWEGLDAENFQIQILDLSVFESYHDYVKGDE